jgi:hypothetical protein
VVAATFLAKLTMMNPHSQVPVPTSTFKTPFVPIPIKAISEAFTGMPKKSAPHRDGWTWAMYRDAADRPSAAFLLRKFVELFVNGIFPKPLCSFLYFAIMIPFHKVAQLERDLSQDPRLRPITIGSLLTRFSCKTLLRLNRMGLAERLLQSNQFSFAILGGVQQVILGCTVALQCNSD